ncbi:MAG: hypothetical protein INR70_06880 [Parafilimonas terrae]|nr:hypothetical protein [Parafilimonas terrae]
MCNLTVARRPILIDPLSNVAKLGAFTSRNGDITRKTVETDNSIIRQNLA